MESIRSRARENLPSVLLTLLSIVQAIALETLWENTINRPELFQASWVATLAWLQISVSFLVIILIWLFYVGLVMRFKWTPTIADLVLPFCVGLLELLLIGLMQPKELAAWFLVLALITAMLHLVSHSLFRRARRDPENEEFFAHINPATWRDHVPKVLSILVVILFGVWLWITDDTEWIALAALLSALFLIIFEIRAVAGFWRTSMGQG
jgi:hypothetical protein